MDAENWEGRGNRGAKLVADVVACDLRGDELRSMNKKERRTNDGELLSCKGASSVDDERGEALRRRTHHGSWSTVAD